ncbi:acyltransferase family protein [Albibacterium profundi]|uniref:Acyltransferase family protein n=1 Tax=Albibacterium profundi TaxID=3134906 RepID=A0ABV5CB00_9SPHI
MRFRNDIQGLRALAVFFVLIFHIDKNWLPGGFIGVDMFFVVSGYLISSIILTKKNKRTFSFKEFYISRIKRIVPAYFVFLIVTTFFVSYIYFLSDAYIYRDALLWSILFVSNSYFAKLDTYFGALSSENPLLHTWTLAVEMQFYLFLPLMLIFLSRAKSRWLLMILTGVLCIYSTYQVIYLGNKDGMYFSLIARSPEFFLGVLLNFYQFNFANKTKLRNVLNLTGGFLLFGSLVFINERSAFPGVTALLPCFGVSLILITKEGPLSKFISNRTFVYIGELSYSIYLWHWPILALYRYYYGKYDIDNVFHLIAILILVAILSWLSYRYVENSFRKSVWNKKRVQSFLLIVFLLGVSGYVLMKINRNFNNFPVEFSSQIAHGLESHAETYVSDILRGDTLSKDTLLLIGDSHALAMNSFFELLGKRNGFCFESVTNSRYVPILGVDSSDIETRYYSQHKKLAEIAFKKMKQSKIIFFAKAWRFEIPSLGEALENIIMELDTNQHVIILSDFPEVNASPIRVNRSITKNRDNPFAWIVSTYLPSEDIFELVRKYENVHYLDLSHSPVFSNTPYYKDTIMYYDDDHLNRYGSEEYALSSEEKFIDFLSTILP